MDKETADLFWWVGVCTIIFCVFCLSFGWVMHILETLGIIKTVKDDHVNKPIWSRKTRV